MPEFKKDKESAVFRFSRQEIIDVVGEERAKILLSGDPDEIVSFRIPSEVSNVEKSTNRMSNEGGENEARK